MADSQITVRVDAETQSAKQNLQEVGNEAKKLGDSTADSASKSYGAILQLSGSVLSLKNGLSALSAGRGGVGALLQVAGAGRAATGAIGALGGGTAAAGGIMAAAFAATAAAVIGVTAEVAKNAVGTEAWKQKSNNALESVIGWWGRAKSAAGEYWKQTAVGSFLDERKARQAQEEVMAVEEQVRETERLNALHGEALRDEIRLAEKAGDAAKVGQLYARMRKEAADEAKREKEETTETANILQQNSVEQAKANQAGEAISRREGAFATARGIAENQQLSKGQQQRLENLEKLVGPAIGARIQNEFNKDPGAEAFKQLADPNAKRQLENNIVNLANSGVAMETIVTALDRKGMGQDEIVKTLEGLQKRLPDGFASELTKRIKPAVFTWK